MNAERWAEIERVFLAALELPAGERQAFLERECGADVELRERVLRMLATGEPAPRFLEPPSPEAGAPLPPDVPDRRLGDFDLLVEIGRGGMGVVFRAWQRSLGRPVAIKVLPKTFTLTARQVERFLREARAAAKLQHPGIVPVLTVGEAEGSYYFAMELVVGHDLAFELVKLREALKRPGAAAPTTLPSSSSEGYFGAIARIVRDVADALAYAHEHGIVHRDVKPSNLLIDHELRVKIVDFGLARDESQGTITRSGDLAGTPHYMSPEQARGRIHQVDARTDVYSLGVVLYELLTLQRPFEGKTSHEILHKILETEPRSVRKVNPRVPRDLETICLTAMAKELKGRYASAGALRDDLDRFLAHQAILARGPALGQRVGRFARRHRLALGGAGLVVVSLAIGVPLASSAAHAGAIRDHWRAAEGLRGEVAFRDLLPGAQAAIREHVHAVLADPGALSQDERQSLTALERELDAYHAELRAQGLEDLERSRDPSRTEGARELLKLSGMSTLSRAAGLFPEDSELQALVRAESAFPTVSVETQGPDGEPIGAEVFAHAVDVPSSAVGPAQRLGTTPLRRAPLPPGEYRITVVLSDGAFREVPAYLGPAIPEVVLRLEERSDENRVTDGMVRLETPGDRYTFPDFPMQPGGLQGRTVDLPPFWIDATEVSNRAYQEFVLATGHPMPPLWAGVEDLAAFLQTYAEYPVTWVPWNDAADFATWSGKRLPTAAEWHRAAGGPENWPLPYSSDPDAAPRGNILQPYVATYAPTDVRSDYLGHAAPVTSFPEARTPEGLYHMYGNVDELTESPAYSLISTDLALPLPFSRFVFGASWSARATHDWMRRMRYIEVGPLTELHHTGFRCARSDRP